MTFPLPKGLSPDEVQAVMGPRLKAVANCAIERSGASDGWLDISYQILGNGTLADVRVEGKPDDAETHACFEKAVSGIRFPAWSKDPEAKSIEHIKLGMSTRTMNGPDGTHDGPSMTKMFRKMKRVDGVRFVKP